MGSIQFGYSPDISRANLMDIGVFFSLLKSKHARCVHVFSVAVLSVVDSLTMLP